MKEPNVTNAKIYYEVRKEENEVVYMADFFCSEGYLLWGTVRTHCYPGKGWKKPLPRCIGKERTTTPRNSIYSK